MLWVFSFVTLFFLNSTALMWSIDDDKIQISHVLDYGYYCYKGQKLQFWELDRFSSIVFQLTVNTECFYSSHKALREVGKAASQNAMRQRHQVMYTGSALVTLVAARMCACVYKPSIMVPDTCHREMRQYCIASPFGLNKYLPTPSTAPKSLSAFVGNSTVFPSRLTCKPDPVKTVTL